MSYTLTQEEYSRLKRRLTYRQNRLGKVRNLLQQPVLTRDQRELLVSEAKQLKKEAEYAQSIFEEKGSPDSWYRWERAKEDAQFIINRYPR